MKKLIFGLLLFPLSHLWADSVTTGNLGLLKPSTNTIDKSRSWADKLNTNFDIIDATFTTIAAQSAASKLNAGSNNAGVIFSSMIAAGQVSATNAIQAGSGNAGVITSSMTNSSLINAGSNNAGVITSSMTNSSLINAGQNNLAVITSSMIAAGVITGGGGGGGISTTTIQIIIPGDVFVASLTAVPISGASYAVKKGTFHALGVDGYFDFGSTATTGWTAFKIAITTAPLQSFQASTFTYVAGDVHISSNNRFSQYYSTAFPVWQDTMMSVHITSVPPSGLMPTGLHVNVHGWFERNLTW